MQLGGSVSNLGYPSIINNNIQGLSINYITKHTPGANHEGDVIDLVQNSERQANYKSTNDYMIDGKEMQF